MESHVRLWLDDDKPAPEGWTTVTTVDAARSLLESGVDEISLGDRLDRGHGLRSALVLWMIGSGHWPRHRPSVHGDRRLEMAALRLAIAAAWPLRSQLASAATLAKDTRVGELVRERSRRVGEVLSGRAGRAGQVLRMRRT